MSETGSPPVSKEPLENPQELILKAIQDGNYEQLDLLLKPGVKLDPELFFIAHAKHGWRMVKILLEHDPSGVHVKKENGETLLMLNINNIEAVRYLLDHGANPSAYAFQEGKSVVLQAMKQPKVKILRLLFQHGADLNKLFLDQDPDYFKSALHYAVKMPECYKKEIFQFFIEEIGMDPSIKDSEGHNIFYYAVSEYGNTLQIILAELERNFPNGRIWIDPFGEVMTKLRQEKTEALEYILTLPQYQLYQDEHPQSIYLKNWDTIPMYEMPEILLSPQFKQTNLITPGFFEQSVNSDCRIERLEELIVNFSPVSLLLNEFCSSYSNSKNDHNKILKFLKSLVKNGFRVDEPDSISPLTLVFFKYMNGYFKVNSQQQTVFKFVTQDEEVGEEAESELVDVTKFLIENDAHVGQSIVPFPANAPEFETLRQDLCLPDAVYTAFESGCFFCLPLVLPYFAQPPLTLLLLTEPNWTALVKSMFPILCKGGPIPPGSRYINDLIAHLQRMNAELKIDHVYNKFLEMHSSPPTLMHLSRCVIRSSYTERASLPEESFPDLMRSFEIPEELKDYLAMPPPKRLDALYCEDPIMARIANEGVLQLELEQHRL